MRRSHWVPDTSPCGVLGCSEPMKMGNRHHCRLCGLLFCSFHSGYQRRLDLNAEPDPDGEFSRVCFDCFWLGKEQEMGGTREHTDYFTAFRADFKSKHVLPRMRACLAAIDSLSAGAPTPKWTPDSACSSCEECGKPFGLSSLLSNFSISRKHHCRLCGGIFCDACSSGRIALGPSVTNPNAAPTTLPPVRACSRCVKAVVLRAQQIAHIEACISSASHPHLAIIERLDALANEVGLSNLQSHRTLEEKRSAIEAIRHKVAECNKMITSLPGQSQSSVLASMAIDAFKVRLKTIFDSFLEARGSLEKPRAV